MNEYQKPYYLLFNAITDALCEIRKMNFGDAIEILTKAQQASEEVFVSFEEEK